MICRKSAAESEQELNRALQDQNVLETFDRFYADDVVMQENSLGAVLGKAANRQRTLDWSGRFPSFMLPG